MSSITAIADPTHHRSLPAAPGASVGVVRASLAVARRTVLQFVRTPQLIVVGALTSTMFLLIFRYVFGGAIGTGPISYVDFLIPALAATSGLFSGGAVGVASDVEGGLNDRLRSLPIPRSSVLIGRSFADTILIVWAAFVAVLVGFATGFRFHGSAADAVVAVGLVVVFAFVCSWPIRLDQLSARLCDSDWLDGAFSAADLLMVTVLRRLEGTGILEAYPGLRAYSVRGEARPAYERAFADQLAVFSQRSG